MNDEQPTQYIDVAEFRDLGYLQEVNRQFLHPLGLALAVYTNESAGDESRYEDAARAAAGEIARRGQELGRILDADECGRAAAKAILDWVWPVGAVFFAGVIDGRSDLEGYYFDTSDDAGDFIAKAERVCAELEQRTPPRQERLGYVVQPLPAGESAA